VFSINKLDHIRGDLIWFFAVGIGKDDMGDPVNGWPLKKFSTLVSSLEDNNVSRILLLPVLPPLPSPPRVFLCRQYKCSVSNVFCPTHFS